MHLPRSVRAVTVMVCLGLWVASGSVAAEAAKDGPAPARGASVVGGALPGGAVISAAFVSVLPVAGGEVVCVPLAADGTFKLEGLAPGRYRLALTSQTVTKQTQGATFGEKVNAGLHAAGSALSQGAAKTNNINAGMPNRISMNVTIAKQNLRVEVDGSPVEVDIASDGKLNGRTAAAATEAPASAAGTR